jgi:hypothetical protein
MTIVTNEDIADLRRLIDRIGLARAMTSLAFICLANAERALTVNDSEDGRYWSNAGHKVMDTVDSLRRQQ